MNRTILLIGVVMGMLAIILGAFGAHGLEKLVDTEAVATFETGVRYQMYHALLLLFLGVWNGMETKTKRTVFVLVLLGVILFSFSIYLLALNSLTSFDFKIIGFLTPIGGVLMILGWAVLGFKILKTKKG
ncbi:DUF423 domain-containing protein [Muricauda sp. 334s03]|uniref:DUF423 domain-containing protein n=1 Tax=Flagellimonas yonaguniensis TaxID=3031325 RepID=A0ABT5XVD4_9FLAO|nr:DUF423 domain-containing protein [[Muricauda] yonaguniensis]MDF0715148.1 DUF423 domain-containing protein [[Muricauda] yonaguniensis]